MLSKINQKKLILMSGHSGGSNLLKEVCEKCTLMTPGWTFYTLFLKGVQKGKETQHRRLIT